MKNERAHFLLVGYQLGQLYLEQHGSCHRYRVEMKWHVWTHHWYQVYGDQIKEE